MAKKSAMVKVISLFLAILTVFSVMFLCFTGVSAAEITKTKKTYDIAVAYDNSGSMFQGKTRWCDAKYAMEIFASMLDYENGDRLNIYTMWPVSIGNNTSQTTTHVTVSSVEDIDKIHNMYTQYEPSKCSAQTPYIPVVEATEALKASTMEEKWLIVLTDGAFNQEGREDTSAKFSSGFPLDARLKSIAAQGIKVQFLGLDLSDETKQSQLYKVTQSENLLVEYSTSSTLKNSLIGICNKIFQRHELKGKLNGSKLKLDISMSKIIVFAQGDSDKTPVLKDASGKTVAAKMDSGLRKFSDLSLSVDRYTKPDYKGDKVLVNNKLFGQVVTFEGLKAGEYTLENVDKNVQIFYEPDVDISVVLKNSDGNEVSKDSKDNMPGEYKIEYSVVDRQTGADVTGSPLMGKNGVEDLKCVAEITNGNDKKEVELASGKSVYLDAGDNVFFNIEGTYLDVYTITTRDNKSDFTIEIIPFPTVKELEIDIKPDDDGYNVSKQDEWKPVMVYLTLDGEKLSADQVARLKSTVNVEGVPFTYEFVPEKSAYAVYIGKSEDGKTTEVEKGSYKVEVNATYTDEYGQAGEPKTEKESISVWSIWDILKWIIIIACIIAFIAWLMLHKSLPAYVALEINKQPNPIRIKGKDVALTSTAHPEDIICNVKKSTPFYKKKTKNAKFIVTNIRPGSKVNKFSIGNYEYIRKPSGEFKDSAENVLSPKKNFSIINGTDLVWYTTRGQRKGKILTCKVKGRGAKKRR